MSETPEGLQNPDPADLVRLATWTMPFGRYKGQTLIDLPEPYVVWFSNNGYPKGKLGHLMRQLYDIKANGLEPVVKEAARRVLGNSADQNEERWEEDGGDPGAACQP